MQISIVEAKKQIPCSLARRQPALALLILGLAFSMAMSGSSRGLSSKGREQVFEKVWKDVEEHYYDPEFGGVNWPKIHQRYPPLVQAAKDDSNFYSILDRMTAELHDAHTRFSSPEQWKNHEKHVGVSVGFRPGYVEGKIVVLDVSPESNAAHSGIEAGMIVTALDGQPITDRLAAAAKTVLPSSTERVTRLRILSNVFAGPLESPFEATLQRGDGSVFEVKFARQILSNSARVTAAKLPSGFGYLRFDEFRPR